MTLHTKLSLLASSAVLLALGGSCTQPRMNCTTAHSNYAAKYTLKSGDPTSPCGNLGGDLLNMQTYFATGGLNGTPKFSEPSLAIRTDTSVYFNEDLSGYGEPYGPDGGPVPIPGYEFDYGAGNALGKFKSGEPDTKDFCYGTDLKPSVISIPELPGYMIPDDPETPEDETETVDPTPATTLRHEWTKARWVVSPDAQGTQFDGTVKVSLDGCSAEYDVIAVSPAIPCTADADCDAAGSGINPDFAVKCDLSLDYLLQPDEVDDPETPDVDETVDYGICIPAKELPSYK